MSRDTTMPQPKVEVYHYDEDRETFTPSMPNGVLKVELVGGTVGGGISFLRGEAVPENELGNIGDVYLNTANGDLFQKEEEWTKIMNLVGPKGDNGNRGVTGAAGADGSKGDTGAAGKDGSKGDTGPPGPAGKDGFPTEEQWNALVADVEALKNPSGPGESNVS